MNKIFQNHLANEVSPYLLQHKNNPVSWWPWCKEALNLSKSDNKPILLSIGYASCHWCHVMAHESFEDEETAQLMNQWFINIKVDKEERPDLDAIYMKAIQVMGQRGGWPLTIFLTPDGKPFFGGTYFPKSTSFRLPAFKDVLIQIHNAWELRKSDIQEVTRNISESLKTKATENIPLPIETLDSLMDKSAERLLQASDIIYGGVRGSPKFPQPLAWEFLWRAGFRLDREDMKKAVKVLAYNLCEGGIYDHIGGGWARYSVDGTWLVPHFEKMLYDNALIISLLTHVWKDSHNGLYETRITETIDWLEREMFSPKDKYGNRAFFSGIDADSEGEEGKYYVWEAREIDEILKKDSSKFKELYGIKEHGNWEGKNILHRNHLVDNYNVLDEKLSKQCRKKLFKVRERRTKPAIDNKILVDWNALVINALIEASIVFSKPHWLKLAKSCYSFIYRNLFINGELYHSFCKDTAKQPGLLEDYANLALAALMLYSATGEERYLKNSKYLLKKADALFFDKIKGGYFKTREQEDLIVRIKEIYDNVTPIGNGSMVIALAHLYHHTNKFFYYEKAVKVINSIYSPDVEPFLASSIMTGIDLLNKAIHIDFIGSNTSKSKLLLLAARFRSPNIIFRQKYNISDNVKPSDKNIKTPYAIVCSKGTCLPPINNVEELNNLLESLLC